MKILIVAAHADDEVLGCGGTIKRLTNEGHEARTLILGDGVSSRDDYNKEEINIRAEQSMKANDLIGINFLWSYGLPDNKFDSIPLLDIVKIISGVIEKYKPDIIFTHYQNDLNIDHRRTFEAVITAARPMNGETVKTIYSFEVASSTEWNFPLSFSPDTYFDISGTIDSKLKAMSIYKNELKDYPHPRSLAAMKIQAEMWGIRTGLQAAEAFVTIRNLQ